MTRVLRSATKKDQNNEDLSSKLIINIKSKTIKRTDEKLIELKKKDKKQSDIWNINSILSNIFSYTDKKDLVQFNSICKKWNNLTNPIIHKTIKLIRKRVTRNRIGGFSDKTDEKYADSDVVECISNNAKHAHLVKEFRYDYKLNPQRAVEIFEIFRFISSLTIGNCDMGQDQFLGMISPLTQLQELTLSVLKIRKFNMAKPYKKAVQLPLSLKKLKLQRISLIDSSELFVQTINSHRNLVEFNYLLESDNNYLESFYKHYPTLLNFKFNNIELESSQLLFRIFDTNPQLINLKLRLKHLGSEMVKYISNYLTNLEELSLSEYNNSYIETNLNFSQPTKIKKLSLDRIRLNNCSLNSILLNCPLLEELGIYNTIFIQPDSIKFRLSNPAKLKKLAIHCDALSGGVFNSILLNYPNISELIIDLPFEHQEIIKSICENSANLDRLKITPQLGMSHQERDTFFQVFYESELFTGSHKCSFTLSNLTLNIFKAVDSKAEYFKNFKKLKSIKYPGQFGIGYNSLGEEFEIKINKELWPGYKLITTNDSIKLYDAEFKRI
jgi:hypothetical protein